MFGWSVALTWLPRWLTARLVNWLNCVSPCETGDCHKIFIYLSSFRAATSLPGLEVESWELTLHFSLLVCDQLAAAMHLMFVCQLQTHSVIDLLAPFFRFSRDSQNFFSLFSLFFLILSLFSSSSFCAHKKKSFYHSISLSFLLRVSEKNIDEKEVGGDWRKLSVLDLNGFEWNLTLSCPHQRLPAVLYFQSTFYVLHL